MFSALFAASAAQATLLNVDFNSTASGTYAGAAVLGTSSSQWNGINGSAVMNNIALADDNGAATTARLTSSSAGFGFAGLASNCPIAAALLCDYLVANDKTITFSLSGLTAGDDYDLLLYSVPQAASRVVTFRQGGTTKTANLGASGQAGVTSYVEGRSYVRYTGTVASNGIVAFDLVGGSFTTEGDINGFQLKVGADGTVPEPAAISLVLAGLAAVALQRRKRG